MIGVKERRWNGVQRTSADSRSYRRPLYGRERAIRFTTRHSRLRHLMLRTRASPVELSLSRRRPEWRL
jgi:hypothetical protein